MAGTLTCAAGSASGAKGSMRIEVPPCWCCKVGAGALVAATAGGWFDAMTSLLLRSSKLSIGDSTTRFVFSQSCSASCRCTESLVRRSKMSSVIHLRMEYCESGGCIARGARTRSTSICAMAAPYHAPGGSKHLEAVAHYGQDPAVRQAQTVPLAYPPLTG